MTSPLDTITPIIANEIGSDPEQVRAAVALLDEGSTVPFIARYRKEATGGLDDGQLRRLEERLGYLRELDARRDVIRKSIEAQGKLTEDLAAEIVAAATKAELEGLYLPFKPKRRTRGQIARERGLEPLAAAVLADRSLDPEGIASAYLGGEVPDTKAALEGARDILVEQFAEQPDLLGRLRRHLMARAKVQARLVAGMEEKGAKYADYFDYAERWATVPSHRALALFRARNEEVVTVEIVVDEDDPAPVRPVEAMIAAAFAIDPPGRRPADAWLMGVVRAAWRTKLAPHFTTELLALLRERAEEEAIRVFSRNLKDLLLAAPAGARPTMGLDPGVRTGVKVAVVDATGKLLETATVCPFAPRNDVQGATRELARLVQAHRVELVAIGNGTASRETDRLVAAMLAEMPSPAPIKVMVSEAGASVYSASATAAAEMPDVDVSLRGAVSIARRLQDPLAELVKIEPKSIGVGQYQHDVDQSRLAQGLDAVVEDAVNAVGVELNTASVSLLRRVSGLGPALAEAIVLHRDTSGRFRNRRELKNVPRLGARAFELCAGFLRIRDGDEPLDASAVHPEAYPLARRIVAACGRDVPTLARDGSVLKTLRPADFVDARFGLPTVRDIFAELEKPARDPRPAFRTASFAQGVERIEDLKPGMVLEGTVSNVAAFGAFVDVGVHEDGLVHVSQLADRFVKDPSEIVKAGDVVEVRVLEVDLKRKRISLSMRKQDAPGRARPEAFSERSPKRTAKPLPSADGAFGAALSAALARRK
jgi:protein Tex